MDTIEHLPLSALRESPFNPRKHYAEDDLLELALSIKDQGVMQPIVARVVPESAADLYFRYEIIFGHRRFRAAAQAQLDRIPVIVREMTDEEAAIAQVHENMKRKDVSPLEEADSYAHLRDQHHMKAEQIGAAVGKTKAYVYARLKLASAAPEVRAAVANDGLSPEIALRIGRLPHHDLQRLALKRMTIASAWPHRHGEDAKGWLPTREAHAAMKSLFSTDLDEAPFDLADAELARNAGACTSCPRRAGNIEGLEDLLKDSICTDASCYEVKRKEYVRLAVVDLRAKGHEVLEGDAAKSALPWHHFPASGYVRAEQTAFHVVDGSESQDVTFAQAIAQAETPLVKTIVVVSPHTGELVHLLTDAEAAEVLEAHGKPAGRFATPTTAGASARRGADVDDEEKYEDESHRAIATRWNAVLDACVSAAAARERTTFELRMVAQNLAEWDDFEVSQRVIMAMGWRELSDEYSEEDVRRLIDAATPDELALLIVLLTLERSPFRYPPSDREGYEADQRAIAAHYDVNPAVAAGLEVAPVDDQSDETGFAGDEETDEPADAGVERVPNTADLFVGGEAS